MPLDEPVMVHNMNIERDPETLAIYIRLSGADVARTVPVADNELLVTG